MLAGNQLRHSLGGWSRASRHDKSRSLRAFSQGCCLSPLRESSDLCDSSVAEPLSKCRSEQLSRVGVHTGINVWASLSLTRLAAFPVVTARVSDTETSSCFARLAHAQLAKHCINKFDLITVPCLHIMPQVVCAGSESDTLFFNALRWM